MTLVIELPPELERELAARASELHLPLEEYAVRVLAGADITAPKFTTGADLVAYWKAEGLVGTRPENRRLRLWVQVVGTIFVIAIAVAFRQWIYSIDLTGPYPHPATVPSQPANTPSASVPTSLPN